MDLIVMADESLVCSYGNEMISVGMYNSTGLAYLPAARAF